MTPIGDDILTARAIRLSSAILSISLLISVVVLVSFTRYKVISGSDYIYKFDRWNGATYKARYDENAGYGRWERIEEYSELARRTNAYKLEEPSISPKERLNKRYPR